MALYNPLKGEYLYDVAAKLYGDTALGIQDILSSNSGLDLDSELYGTEITYSAGLTRVKPVFARVSEPSGAVTYKTRYKQTIYDLAVQLYGDVSKIGNLLEYFPNLDNEIPVGSEVVYTPNSDPIAEYFMKNNLIVTTGIVIEADEPSGFDADYQAILDYATSQAWTLPSDDQQTLQNAFLVALKDVEIWDELDVLYVPATDGGADFAKINWKSPGDFTLSEVNTVTFTENIGFAGNGTNSYLDTGWAPDPDGVNFTLNDASAFVYSNNNLELVSRAMFGVRGNSGDSQDGQTNLSASTGSANSRVFNVTGQGVTSESTDSTIGLFLIARVDASNIQISYNGDTPLNNAAPSTSLSTQTMYLDAFNLNGTTGQYGSFEIGLFGTGASLDGKESALYNAWNDYFTSL